MQPSVITNNIFDIRDIPKQEDCELGIVISMNKGWHKQCHCGIAYDMGENIKILHLATDKCVKLSNDLEREYFLYFVRPNLHPIRRKALNEYLKIRGNEVLSGNDNIRYGFQYDEWAYFDDKGILHLGDNEIGLTCATYVLTLFHSVGIDLVDIQNWPAREKDNEWFDLIIDAMCNNGMSKDHLQKLQEQKGCPRFHPEEITVAGALYQNAPAETQIIWTEGAKFWQMVLQKAKDRKLEKKIFRKYGKLVRVS